ncbi:MAG: hypothetical protein CSA97_05450 [Bacteroidetes bacterium]|nr:MAG: hypothetical protein CSA97_05450 [Bacteroidota bacterium]
MWGGGLYLHPPVLQESQRHARIIFLLLSGVNPYILKVLELLLLLGTAFAVRMLMNRLFSSLFRTGIYILLACLSATSLSLTRTPMLAPEIGMLLIIYGSYLLAVAGSNNNLSSRVLRASFSISVASLLFFPYTPLLLLAPLATIQQRAMDLRIFCAWLVGTALPHAFSLAACYLFGLPLLAYLPDYSIAGLSPEVLLNSMLANPLRLAYWLTLIALWIVAELLYPPQLSSQRNSFLLARNLRIFTIVSLLLGLVLANAAPGITLALGLTITIPIARMLLSTQRVKLKTLLFITLLAMATITQLVGY